MMDEREGLTPAEAYERRLEKQAKADRLFAEMQTYKQKLKDEIRRAEEAERYYENNRIFGAF